MSKIEEDNLGMQLEVGVVVEGKVTGITNFGVFVEIPGGKTGMVHISEVAQTYVNEIREHVKENQLIKVKVLSIGDDGKVSLSIKRAMERPVRPKKVAQAPFSGRPDGAEWTARRNDNLSFEDMMLKFKQTSDDKFSDLKRKNTVVKRGKRSAAK